MKWSLIYKYTLSVKIYYKRIADGAAVVGLEHCIVIAVIPVSCAIKLNEIKSHCYRFDFSNEHHSGTHSFRRFDTRIRFDVGTKYEITVKIRKTKRQYQQQLTNKSLWKKIMNIIWKQ